jgi:cytochrome c5
LGEQIYQSKCNACHGTGVAGAPKLDDANAWAPRIAQGMDTLLANATTGLNAMPPKGTCADCSEADLKAAVEYMVEQVQ